MIRKEKKKVSPQISLIEKLKNCQNNTELLVLLKELNTKPPKFPSKDYWDNWKEVIERFEKVLETVKPNFEKSESNDSDLQTSFAHLHNDIPEKELIVQILRFTTNLRENCKQGFTSMKSLSSLIELDDLEIVAEALKLISAFVKRSPKSNRRRGNQDVSLESQLEEKLFTLSQGWGPSLLQCGINQQLTIPLHFEFYVVEEDIDNSAKKNPTLGQNIIHIENLHKTPESPIQVLQQLVEKLCIPKKYHFALFSRIRLVKSFPNMQIRTQLLYIRLITFSILAQSKSNEQSFIASFFRMEPNFLLELMDLICSENTLSQDIRAIAIKCLISTTSDAHRLATLLTSTGTNSSYGTLPSAIRKVVAVILSGQPHQIYDPSYIESLFSLVSALVNTPAGTSALKSAGIVPTIITLLDPTCDYSIFKKAMSNGIRRFRCRIIQRFERY
eukprot:TRINITY_DN8086_c0_g1_i3.p1 TRINITY_DN8086_c0_g1~~TRINITY_DN8086_c0_g1_i3.p1  ORF type:complete len:444 (+),score=71.32 TRINITY_DN8086_c0_g1_i3:165-1496(+)